MKKYIIWESDPDLDEKNLACIREDMKEMEVDGANEMSNEEIREYFVNEINPDYLDCEMSNLSQPLPGAIIVIADLGLWNGRRPGYRIMGTNLNQILRSHVNGASDFSIFGDGYNIRADEAHHDGTNHYLYRMLRPGKNHESLLEAIYSGKEITSGLLNRYTMSLYPYAARVYGWPCRSKTKEVTRK